MVNIAVYCLIGVLALVAAGFIVLLCKAGRDDLKNLKGRADGIIAPLVCRAGGSEVSSGCVVGRVGTVFDGRIYRYTADCLLECTPAALCCVTLRTGEPEKRYTFYTADISLCKVRRYANGYRITVIADGKKSMFAAGRRSPMDIIPQQAERMEKFIDILCKAVGVNIP